MCLIGVGAQLCRTPALQDRVWAPRIYSIYLFFWQGIPHYGTLLKIKVLKMLFKRCHWRTIFGSTKNHPVKGSLSYLFIIWRTFFHHKEAFVKQKGSSDIKGSLWNHLDNKVLLWHRELAQGLKCVKVCCFPSWEQDTASPRGRYGERLQRDSCLKIHM